MERKIFKTKIAGKELTAEFNPIAARANGSVMVTLGETTVFATAVMSPAARETVEYFPLTVDYEEKFYATGKILGSRFIRREGRPTTEAVLICRLVDRTLRPLFNHRIRHDIHVVAFTVSLDEENSPDILSIIASSLALLTSNIPWDGPVSAVRVGIIDGKRVINPSYEERKNSTMDLVVSGTDGRVNMLEGKANEVSEADFLVSVEDAMKEINVLNEFQMKIASEIGKEKVKPELEDIPDEAKKVLQKHLAARIKDAVFSQHIDEKKHSLSDLKHEWLTVASEQFSDLGRGSVSDLFEEIINDIVHDSALIDDTRADGRGMKDVRELSSEVGLLARTHGSGLFFRGDTHILSVVTLGAPGDEQLIEGMEVQTKKRFMHHYNFPPFSVGETGRLGFTSRRSIGHGALAEKALEAVIPAKEVFPYTIRIVSETLSSNGSSSMGSVCGSTLALMDAGVPITKPVAGIAMGLMMESEDKYKVLTDIQGPEDHHGDMDFKAAGTVDGITAVQMDVKVKGVTSNMLKDALADAREARLKIIKVLTTAIERPREELSKYAPRVFSMKIAIDKIRDVIGPGGKVINEIIAETGAQIDIEQTGDIFITGKNKESAMKALDKIESIIKEFVIGDKAKGKVTRIFDFGAMVEIAPRQEGLVHISELADFRVGKVTDIVNVGDEVEVKVVGIDSMGRVNLSIKAVKETDEETKTRLANKPSNEGRKPRR